MCHLTRPPLLDIPQCGIVNTNRHDVRVTFLFISN